MRNLGAVLFALMLSSINFAQVAPAKDLPFPRFTQSQGKLDDNGFPLSGARLCVRADRNLCYQVPSHTPANSDKVAYEFGLEPRSERLQLPNGGSWVFFTAKFSGGGSGTLERITVLRYQSDGGGKIENLMPFVGVTNVSERAMWGLPKVSAYPIFVHADFIWEDGEIHFGDHHYTVDAWTFDKSVGHYIKAFSYRTSRLYGGGDASPIRVLAGERSEILHRLETK